jgi:hypothetical protein
VKCASTHALTGECAGSTLEPNLCAYCGRPLNYDSVRLANAALADEASLVEAPWTVRRDVDESAGRVEDRDPDEFTVLDGAGMWVAKAGSDHAAADFIATARSREPKLAREVLRQAEEIELLRRELATWQRAVGRLDDKDAHEVYAWVEADLKHLPTINEIDRLSSQVSKLRDGIINVCDMYRDHYDHRRAIAAVRHMANRTNLPFDMDKLEAQLGSTMTPAEKCEAVIKNIVERCNADVSEDGGPGSGKPVVKFAPDWGGNSLTLYIGDDHTHVGASDADYPFESLVDRLYDQLLEGKGLSFQIAIEPSDR